MKVGLNKSNNRSIEISKTEIEKYSQSFLKLNSHTSKNEITNRIIKQDTFDVLKFLPDKFVDLFFLDPPYNMNKKFNSTSFSKRSIDDYSEWLEHLISESIRLLKPSATIYICGDWFSSTSIHLILNKFFKVRNRITWEREKGRGAKQNWKNSSEDIWFATLSDEFTFNVEDVKLKRKVLAPYKVNGSPKDWEKQREGDFRLTYPSNLWTDITVPFWSMPENTEHPTQKPEKLIAKIILASSNENDLIFDPFLGSGTSAVVASKLNRKFVGIELDEKFAAIASKRIKSSEEDKRIQGYSDNVFWERNTLSQQNKSRD